MKKKLLEIYNSATLATKIRCSYLVLLVPMMLFLGFCFYILWEGNRQYEDMINATVVASEFSLDFKKDFDYETYLLIVGNKSMEESNLDDLLNEAGRIVTGLEELADSREKRNRLRSVEKYLKNLGIYTNRIRENLAEGNKYEDNIQIWENDVQIVTSLVQKAISEYIHYEVRGIQESRARYQNFFMTMIQFSIVVFLGFVVLILFLSYRIPLSITQPITELSRVTDQVARGDLTVRSDVGNCAEASMLSESLNTMIDKINELLEQVKKEQIRLRKAEFELLQSQINPHFLYNTLDAIVWLAEAGEQKKVVSMVGSLSEFFRASLNQGKDMIPVREELQHVRSYLEIQQVRYQDILKYEICVPQELNRYLIPKITIQPLVENALYHGIKNKRSLGKITVSGRKETMGIVIRVEDNGIGITEKRLEEVREGIQRKMLTGKDFYGLYNVNERIRLNFGEKYGIFIDSVYGEGTRVDIVLPYMEEEKADEESQPFS